MPLYAFISRSLTRLTQQQMQEGEKEMGLPLISSPRPLPKKRRDQHGAIHRHKD
ncbi:MAG: hypothetical protein JW927_14185 [Deltaproteobacteria bacterium]|nr:hypothetical protein [Deltaproteobacteria bacterium]